MSSAKTDSLQLNKWVPTDYVSMSEFNDNFQKIDDAHKGVTTQLAENASIATQEIQAVDDRLTANTNILQTNIDLARSEQISPTRIADNSLSSSKLKIATNADRIKLANLADEVLQVMAGTTPVNATPANASVTTEKIADGALQPEKFGFRAYPFLETSKLLNNIPTKGFTNNAVILLNLYNADPTKRYYVSDFWSNHALYSTRSFVVKSQDRSIVYQYVGSAPGTGVESIKVTATDGSVMVATIDWTKVITQTSNYQFVNTELSPTIITNIAELNRKTWLMPNNLRVLPGNKYNLYFNNVLRYGEVDDFHYLYTTYTQYFIPRTKKHLEVVPQNVADYTWRVTGYDKNNMFKPNTKNVNVKHVSPTSGDGLTKKILYIGDSMTNAAQYTQFLLDKFNAPGEAMNIEPIGTRGTGANKHEGRSGWRAHEYVNRQTGEYGEIVTNPFWNPATSKFDFSYYMSQNGFAGVDIVMINLGTNDVARTNFNADSDIVDSYQFMIDSIKAYNANIKILLWLPPTRSQLLFNSRDAVDVALRANDLIIKNFDNKEGQNIWLVPVGMAVDPEYDYATTDLPRSEGSSETFRFATDTIHPTSLGYRHMADVIYPYIKYVGGLA